MLSKSIYIKHCKLRNVMLVPTKVLVILRSYVALTRMHDSRELG